MTMHGFTLILDATHATDAQMDAVAAISNELMLCSSGGRAFVAVDRKEDTLDTALRSAISDVETALPDTRVVRVEVERADRGDAMATPNLIDEQDHPYESLTRPQMRAARPTGTPAVQHVDRRVRGGAGSWRVHRRAPG